MNKYVVLGFVFTILLGINAQADLVDDWSRNAEVLSAKISPEGDHLAVMKVEDDQRVVAVFTFPAMKLINVVDFPGRTEVGDYWWVNDERLIFRVNADSGNSEDDASYGELYAVNADGQRGKYLDGLRADQPGTTGARASTVATARASASYTHPMWDDDDQVLITLTDWDRGFKSTTSTAVLDVYTGRLTDRLMMPTANASVIADLKGKPRFSFYVDEEQNLIIHERNPESGHWQAFSKWALGESQVSPIEVAEDGRIYVFKSENEGPQGIYLMDLSSKEFELVYQHELVDADVVYRDYADRVYGASSMPGKSEQYFIDQEHPHSQLMQGLRNVFPTAATYVTSSTHDFDLTIVGVAEDVRTTEYYLFNRGTAQLQQLFDSRPWIDDDLLSPMQPIQLKARDGLTLHGYLTIPKGAEPKNLPLVIVPHSGLHGARDSWGFQRFEGFIPAAGYAMLQVNFRGSGGYGTAFENAGYGEWSGKMLDDLTDSVRWAIEQGYADPERICIFGWSYGGYAAAMSISREPDLYKCSVAGAGIYDNEVQYDSSKSAEGTRWSKSYLDKAVGSSKQERAAASPASFAAKIKTPLLLVHGENDLRVPLEQAYVMQKAMEAAAKPVPELIELPNDGHTPRKEENNLRWRRATIDFIDKHIGPGVKPKAVASQD